MKVITIGRNFNNDYVVQDTTVSRHHCQIVQDNYGNYRIVDFGSKNGTYVNGNKIYGEIDLRQNDIVRIGNTTLQWQIHFNPVDEPPPQQIPDTPSPPSYRKPINVLGIIVLILGIINVGIVGYIIINFYVDYYAEEVKILGLVEATKLYFPWYLKNDMIGLIIGALVLSGLVSLIAEAVMDEKDVCARIGQYLASFAGGLALLFLVFALFAKDPYLDKLRKLF